MGIFNILCIFLVFSSGYSFSSFKSLKTIRSKTTFVSQPFVFTATSQSIKAYQPTLFSCSSTLNDINSSKKKSNISSFFRMPMILRLFFSTITTIFLFGRRVFAKGFPKSSGWDLYGRVPYDDWLFSTWTLSDPNLLKRSFVEAITDEVGLVLGNYKHNQRLFELSMLSKGIVVAGLVLFAFGSIVKFSQEMSRRQLEREDRLRGFSIPISAVTKGARRMGKQIKGMEDGFIDMEAYEDDDDDDTDGGNTDNKGGKKGKDGKPKGKRPKTDDDDEED